MVIPYMGKFMTYKIHNLFIKQINQDDAPIFVWEGHPPISAIPYSIGNI